MIDFKGKRGIIFGVANHNSIAAAIATELHKLGADLAFSYLPDKEGTNKMERRVRKVTDAFESQMVYPCNVAEDASLDSFFDEIKKSWGSVDFVVHSVAYADLEDIRCPTVECSREGFKRAVDISSYSLAAISRRASEIMPQGGSILAMSYFGGEKVVAGYNMMGVCKATLEAFVKYIAYDLGEKNIRVNSVSAGPIRTLAASAIGDFKNMMNMYEAISPLGKNVTAEQVAKSCTYLLSDAASGVTGENHHVDGGYFIMGSPGRASDKITQSL